MLLLLVIAANVYRVLTMCQARCKLCYLHFLLQSAPHLQEAGTNCEHHITDEETEALSANKLQKWNSNPCRPSQCQSLSSFFFFNLFLFLAEVFIAMGGLSVVVGAVLFVVVSGLLIALASLVVANWL